MGRILRALLITIMMLEIVGMFAGASVWALLSEFHASLPVLIGGEAIAGFGVLVLGVILFQRALASERRLEEEPEAEPAAV